MKHEGQIEYILVKDDEKVYEWDQLYDQYLEQWLKNLPHTYNWKLVIERIKS